MKKQLPSDWQKKPFKDVAEVITGTTPSKKNPEFYGGNIPFITPAELGDNGPIMKASTYLSDTGVKKARLLPKDTILVTCIGTLGKVGIADQSLVTNQQINSLVFDTGIVFPKYAYFYCKTLRPVLKSLAPSTTVAIINKSKFSALEIPLPPLAEQKRIAAILDKADAIRRKRQVAIKLADDFLRATFLDMFGDPVTNPKGWETAPLNDFGLVTTGNTPARKKTEFYGDGIEWIKSDNINTPYHFLTKAEECLSTEGEKVARKVSPYSTLVTCIAGSFDCIGNVALSDREVAFNQQINALTPGKGTDPFFLYCLILNAKKLIQNASTNSMKGMVSKGKFEQILFFKPPISLQQKFGSFFQSYIQKICNIQMLEILSGDLFNSLSQRTFRREL